jgi:hypothetical protein
VQALNEPGTGACRIGALRRDDAEAARAVEHAPREVGRATLVRTLALPPAIIEAILPFLSIASAPPTQPKRPCAASQLGLVDLGRRKASLGPAEAAHSSKAADPTTDIARTERSLDAPDSNVGTGRRGHDTGTTSRSRWPCNSKTSASTLPILGASRGGKQREDVAGDGGVDLP